MSTPSLYTLTLSITAVGEVPVLAKSEREARQILRQVAATWGEYESPQGHRLRIGSPKIINVARGVAADAAPAKEA